MAKYQTSKVIGERLLLAQSGSLGTMSYVKKIASRLALSAFLFSPAAYTDEPSIGPLGGDVAGSVTEYLSVQEAHVRASKQVFQSADPTEQREGFKHLYHEYLEGSAFSAGKVGWAYQHGYGTEPDLNKALEFYEFAASNGMTYWQILLSHAYGNGYLGLPQNAAKEAYWRNFEPKVHVAIYECWVAAYYEDGIFPEDAGKSSFYEEACAKASQ